MWINLIIIIGIPRTEPCFMQLVHKAKNACVALGMPMPSLFCRACATELSTQLFPRTSRAVLLYCLGPLDKQTKTEHSWWTFSNMLLVGSRSPQPVQKPVSFQTFCTTSI